MGIGFLVGAHIVGIILLGAFVSGVSLSFTQSNSCGVLVNLKDHLSGNSIIDSI